MYHHFLGFKFLVRNEEKNEIPCQGTRKIRGIFWPTYLPNLSPKSEQKMVHKFFKKTLKILGTQFLTPHTIFIAFLCINVLQISN